MRYTVKNTNIAAAITAGNTGALAPLPELTVSGSQNGHIEEDADYRFFLYRHWSLYESMRHSSYIAARFPVWKGNEERFKELFAKIGVSLEACQQCYRYMLPNDQ